MRRLGSVLVGVMAAGCGSAPGDASGGAALSSGDGGARDAALADAPWAPASPPETIGDADEAPSWWTAPNGRRDHWIPIHYSHSTLVVAGTVTPIGEVESFLSGDPDRRSMRLLSVAVDSTLMGAAGPSIEVISPETRHDFAAGERGLFFLSPREGRWFDQASFAVGPGDMVGELGLTLGEIGGRAP